MSKTVVRKTNHLTMLFVASNVPCQKRVLYKNLVNVNSTKTKCKTQEKSEAARKRKKF